MPENEAHPWLEVVRERSDLGRVRAALFDFDGTISLIRQGWQQVMAPFMSEVLVRSTGGTDESEMRSFAEDFIARTTGKQTIYQMIGLAQEIKRRGGVPGDAKEYKAEYVRRLLEMIADRVKALENGSARPEDFLVPGSWDFLRSLQQRGVAVYCASGTDEPYLRHEAELLGVGRFFEGGARGAQEDYESFSKKDVIRSIIREKGLGGSELAVFGDGFVEIEEGAAVSAHTVGVATSEEALLSGRSGAQAVDEWKRRRLIDAGADVIIPDFSRSAELVSHLCGEVR